MNLTTSVSSHLKGDNSLTFLDPSSRNIIEIKKENEKLVYYIKSKDHSSRMSIDRLPSLLRQFTHLSQISAFFKNGNLIKAKQRDDQEYCLEVLLSCQGGIAWVPILIWLATTGITIVTDRWLVRPYLIQPLKDKIQNSGMSKSSKKVACFALDVADFALMTLLGGALEAGVKAGMTQLFSKQAADVAVKVFEKGVTQKVVEHMAKEGTTATVGTSVSQGLDFFKELAMGAKDFLRFEDTVIDAAARHGLEESVLKQAFASFYYQLGAAVPKMATSLIAINYHLAHEQKKKILSEKSGEKIWAEKIEDLEGHQRAPIPQETIRVSKPEAQKQQNLEKIRRDEKKKTGKRIYLKHIGKGLEINDELKMKIQEATNLPDRSVEKLVEKLMQKYPPGSEVNSDTSSLLSGLSHLTLGSTDGSTPSSSLRSSVDNDDRNIDELTDFGGNNSPQLMPTFQFIENAQIQIEPETDLGSHQPSPPISSYAEELSQSKYVTTYKYE